LGYILGDNWTAAEDVIRTDRLAALIVIIIGGAWWVAHRWRHVRAE